jgi:DNA-binding NarL/FixJ family response regulator
MARRGDPIRPARLGATPRRDPRRFTREAPPAVSRLRESLSDRELEVLRCLARGASNKEIATELRIAEGTVKNHMTNIFEKLEVDDRTRAALKAREVGLTRTVST